MSEEKDVCQEYSVNPEAVAAAKSALPDTAILEELSRMFAAFSDASRLRILLSISERELCVCELGEVLGMSMPAVSHHLRRLKDLGLVRTRREGKLVYYSLDDEHVREILAVGREHLAHRQLWQRGKQ
ncbi:MAG: helix-turn-helix transcriptional regulator [Firmicutes bacterium]|nr:helix-turn-helix transcriptional regulator [Bacillota bacterium]